ncbi:type II toxin-antitoxin system PemK/MazF family toxin [Mesorhizobium sp. B263B2A]|uniref:type II toxin-antitoxin system PemK/MazF family toxin n=1 Tax=Mesorhizobium sp. B263B2A TaxID=2876669 RepID=UPI001CD09776|nr:type II toxin-antitoxin system PemK/MazF family toxin [Mesorhizobium sp. B263B2A]MCA0029621.1 type II toxin-antitoxin system PemK/MazF family toxin [Mesorhizobium sp. B263B2A]
MSLPKPIPGLVICYSYLWAKEHETGAEEGRKGRPCAIVAARQVVEGREVVTVVPITHSPPFDSADAVEIPATLKTHLGLDDAPSWIVVTETNDFLWPGPDLRPIPRSKPSRFDDGMLPPRFYAYLRDRILAAHKSRTLNRIQRTE